MWCCISSTCCCSACRGGWIGRLVLLLALLMVVVSDFALSLFCFQILFFFFFILVLAIFFVVQENMKSTKKYERNSILFRIFECRVDLEHILFLCFSRRLVWSAASPSCSSHGAWSSWLHRSSSTLFLVSSFFLSFFLSFSSSFISLFFSCHCPYFSFFFLPFIII